MIPKNTRRDLGSGSVRQLLVQLAVPAVAAQIINLLYNVVDRIYIGHIPGIGASALTGVGLFMPICHRLNSDVICAGPLPFFCRSHDFH